MARLKNSNNLQGSLGELTYYSRKGSNEVFVRTKSGLSKDQIKTQDEFVNIRRNNMEFGACSKMGKEIRSTFAPFAHLTDFHLSPGLCSLAKRMQKADTQNTWGERSIQLSRFRQYLVGCEFKKISQLSALISIPLAYTLNRDKQEAMLELAEFSTAFALTLPEKYPCFRLSICLGLASDYKITADKTGYEACHDRAGIVASSMATDWYSTQGAVAQQQLVVNLDKFGVALLDSDTLILTFAIEFASLDITGKAEIVKGVGAGKILAVG